MDNFTKGTPESMHFTKGTPESMHFTKGTPESMDFRNTFLILVELSTSPSMIVTSINGSIDNYVQAKKMERENTLFTFLKNNPQFRNKSFNTAIVFPPRPLQRKERVFTYIISVGEKVISSIPFLQRLRDSTIKHFGDGSYLNR